MSLIRKPIFAALAMAAVAASGAAHAGGVHWSIGINLPGPPVVGYAPAYPAPVYVQPPVVYAPPPPPVYAPRVVYGPPMPVVVEPGRYPPGRHWHHHWQGERRGYDRGYGRGYYGY